MKKLIFIVLTCILVYTRFVNIGWGLPYPMHPDERNMAAAVQSLNCNFKFQISNFKLNECLNPHFFAYGQFPLYIAYGGIQIYHSLFGIIGQPSYIEATIALRALSAISSILLVFVLMKIAELILTKLYVKKNMSIIWFISFVFLIFQPYAIQLSHFGTTESILMLFYTLIIFFSLKLLTTNHYPLSTIFFLALFSGLALGTKISSLLFLGVPLLLFLIKIIGGSCGRAPDTHGLSYREGALAGRKTTGRIYYFYQLLFFSVMTLFVFLVSSPQNILNWNDFISSMTYESRVGLGRFVAFYTRQFVDTTPVLFQFQKILPFALGWPTLIGGILGFFLLPSSISQLFHVILQAIRLKRTQKIRKNCLPIRIRQFWSNFGERTEYAKLLDILRFALLLSFLPPSFFFSKWTRFVSPSFPLFSLFAILFMIDLYSRWKRKILHRYVFFILCLLFIIPGIAQLSIYTTPDVRFIASEWMYKNIPSDSKILTETANVIDIPIPSPDSQEHTNNYLLNSFDFYDLDANQQLQIDLSEALNKAEYIIIPSRRIFKNHSNESYPLLTNYYEELFSGSMGFEKIAEFSSYPKIELFGKTLWEFPDESAEETWTVFDHPVIRIYKRMTNDKFQISNKSQASNLITNNKTDFSNYQVINYQIPTSHYSLATSHSLLVADTPEKWERGLMYVKSKEDIGGLDGMIFTFPDSQSRTFWNKNTLSSLTLYWIQDKKIVGVSDLPSITETGIITTVSSPSPADFVIEIIN